MMRVREGLELIRSSDGRRWLWGTARQRLYSRHVAVGVRRDLSMHVAGVKGRDLAVVTDTGILDDNRLVVRQLHPDDDLSFIAAVPGLTAQAAQERAGQRWLLNSDLPAPWVAVDPDGKVRFMTFLLTSRDNAAMRAVWGELLPELQPDEALFENPWTSESDRGLGIMAEACARILQVLARDFGVRYVMGFIMEENVAALKVVELGGLAPFLKREETWFLFRRRIRFLPVANATK
jgi:hypothetical protein